jgi:hypothetical protein
MVLSVPLRCFLPPLASRPRSGQRCRCPGSPTRAKWRSQNRRAYQRELFGGNKARLQRELGKVNRELGKRHLTKKQEAILLRKREHIREELGAVEGQLAAVEGPSEAQEALERNTEAIKEHTAASKELKDSIDKQTQLGERVSSTTAATALQMLADSMSGMIGARMLQANRTAGAGTIGRA